METLSTEELQNLKDRNEDLVLVNVLPEPLFATAHIPGSANIPLDTDNFVERVRNRAGDPRKKIVVYSANPRCNASPNAARKLEQAGFQHVYDFTGGTEAWMKARLPFQTGSRF